MGNKRKSKMSHGSAGGRAAKKGKSTSSKDPKTSGGSGAAFASVSMNQKNDTRVKKELARRVLKVKSLARLVQVSDSRLRRFVLNPKPKKRTGYDPALRGMALTGPARPAADIEISDHGCGLRVFECRKRCVRDEDRPKETDMFALYADQGRFHAHAATRAHIRLLRQAGDACRLAGRTSDALAYYDDALRLDATDAERVGPRTAAAAMDAGDAAKARSVIEQAGVGWVGSGEGDDGSTSDNLAPDVTFAWTMFLVEYISHFLLEEAGSGPELVEEALHVALNTNRHVALFMSLPGVFEQAVDGDTMMQHVANHHYLAEEAEEEEEIAVTGAAASSGAKSAQRRTPSPMDMELGNSAPTKISAALAYCIDQFGCWRDAGDVRDYVWNWTFAAYRTPLAEGLSAGTEEGGETGGVEPGVAAAAAAEHIWRGPENKPVRLLYKNFCLELEDRRNHPEQGPVDEPTEDDGGEEAARLEAGL